MTFWTITDRRILKSICFLKSKRRTGGGESIFDNFTPDDLILAFFPCTRFEAKIPLAFRGELFQQKNWDDEKKLHYSMDLHEELHRNYMLISKMVLVAMGKGLRLVIENPYTDPHYLTMYWCIKPAIIDKNRRDNGDYMKKPTQFYFIGFKPLNNLIFEALDYVEYRREVYITNKDGKNRQVRRSEIHPQYANRFIRRYLIEEE